MTKQAYTYSAYTNTSDGITFEHKGTLAETKKLATEYANEAFPKSAFIRYGPTIVIRVKGSTLDLIKKRLWQLNVEGIMKITVDCWAQRCYYSYTVKQWSK